MAGKLKDAALVAALVLSSSLVDVFANTGDEDDSPNHASRNTASANYVQDSHLAHYVENADVENLVHHSRLDSSKAWWKMIDVDRDGQPDKDQRPDLDNVSPLDIMKISTPDSDTGSRAIINPMIAGITTYKNYIHDGADLVSDGIAYSKVGVAVSMSDFNYEVRLRRVDGEGKPYDKDHVYNVPHDAVSEFKRRLAGIQYVKGSLKYRRINPSYVNDAFVTLYHNLKGKGERVDKSGIVEARESLSAKYGLFIPLIYMFPETDDVPAGSYLLTMNDHPSIVFRPGDYPEKGLEPTALLEANLVSYAKEFRHLLTLDEFKSVEAFVSAR